MTATNLRSTSQLIQSLPHPKLPRLPAPPYDPDVAFTQSRVAFAVASMKDHMTSEGWEIMLGLQHAGYTLHGHNIGPNLTDVKKILELEQPTTLVIQDKREWDLAPKDFRDPLAHLTNYLSLKDHPEVFKVTILKDAHQRPGYHSESASEMGVHAWIVYYHPKVVCHVAPYVRPEHLIRTYHSTDKGLYTWLGSLDSPSFTPRPNKTLLSGAMSAAYPLRMYIRDHSGRFPGMTTHRHPGYHRNGCATPAFIEMLQKYKVAICTSSIYGYTLRKIIEATAAGCMVITDLPTDEILPHIDANLIRVPSDAGYHEIYHCIMECYRRYDLDKQVAMARACLDFYDYQAIGERLAWDIEMMRRNYPKGLSSNYELTGARTVDVTPTEEWRGTPITHEGKLEPAPLTITFEEQPCVASAYQPMTEERALAKMIAPGTHRPGKWRGGVIQIWVTRACDKACFSCTQGSNLGGKQAGRAEFITPEQFEQACISLKGYFGVVGMFGGNPATHPKFIELCEIMRRHVPYEQRGLWCNNLISQEKGVAARETFNPRHSNLNVHLDREAYQNFKRWWPESMPFGLDKDSRHSPPFVAMKDVLREECPDCGGSGDGSRFDPCSTCGRCQGEGWIYDESHAWELISDCDINKHWSAMIGVFRGQLRAWFCEIAGAQAMLHQWETVDCSCKLDSGMLGCKTCDANGPNNGVIWSYPDTGLPIPAPNPRGYNYRRPGMLTYAPLYKEHWWELPMTTFANQVRKHCHECGVPLRGYGQLAQSQEATEQVSETHKGVYVPKVKGRPVELVTELVQLGQDRITRVTDYIGNAER